VDITMNLVPDVQVLSVTDPITAGTGGEDTLVTLALKPVDSQRVVYGQNAGTVWLALLPPNEKGVKTPPTIVARIAR
jgi:hypothetical protein